MTSGVGRRGAPGAGAPPKMSRIFFHRLVKLCTWFSTHLCATRGGKEEGRGGDGKSAPPSQIPGYATAHDAPPDPLVRWGEY